MGERERAELAVHRLWEGSVAGGADGGGACLRVWWRSRSEVSCCTRRGGAGRGSGARGCPLREPLHHPQGNGPRCEETRSSSTTVLSSPVASFHAVMVNPISYPSVPKLYRTLW